MGSLVKKVAQVAIPIAITAATGNPMLGQLASAGLSMAGGSQRAKSGDDSALQLAQVRQAELQQQQQAAQLRQQAAVDNQETKLSGQLSAQRRGIAARRKSRGSLSFSGSTGLPTTLSGQ